MRKSPGSCRVTCTQQAYMLAGADLSRTKKASSWPHKTPTSHPASPPTAPLSNNPPLRPVGMLYPRRSFGPDGFANERRKCGMASTKDPGIVHSNTFPGQRGPCCRRCRKVRDSQAWCPPHKSILSASIVHTPQRRPEMAGARLSQHTTREPRMDQRGAPDNLSANLERVLQ